MKKVVSLPILKELPALDDILAVSEDTLANKIEEFYESRSKKWAEEKAQDLKKAAAGIHFKRHYIRVIY